MSIEERINNIKYFIDCVVMSGIEFGFIPDLKEKLMSENDDATMTLIESFQAAAITKNDKIIKREIAMDKSKLIDKGKLILGLVLAIHESIILSQDDFNKVLASPQIALIERCLLNGSLGTAKTTLKNLDITDLPHTEEIRTEMLNFFDIDV